ncbi:MAG TPA: hypothetical protein VLC95_08230 [Anaerolineae bacterium]|nr:hypothetical protein [Anaerolineae bacterium]
MASRQSSRTLLWLTRTLALISVFMIGCAEVEVIDTTPVAGQTEAFTSPLSEQSKHDLAVMTVEFDPPLNYQQLIARRQSVALLVVVENKGTTTEREVVVEASLTSAQDSTLSITQQAVVDRIAPGEIRIVRFGRLDDIPYRETYHLEVAVEPVDEESNLSNNRKAFEIQIHRD